MREDTDQVLESCKDESKAHQEELKISQNGKNELFYDTRSGDEWDKENDADISERGDSCDDLPEIVVCYKENTYHVVKDICVDEGVPVQEKFLFGDKDSVKCSSEADKTYVNPFETVSSEDSSNSKVDDSVKCSSSSDQCGLEDLLKADNVNPFETKFGDSEICNDLECTFADGESSSCNQEMLIVTEEVKEFPSLSLNPFEIECEESSKDEEMATSSKGSLTLGDILSREDEERPEEQSPLELEEPRKEDDKISSQEPNKDSEKPETKNQEQSFLLMDSYEEGDKLFSSGFGFGETSFSVAEPPVSISGHITYSGAIAFSGSLSVRSDASTTSTRSFAFPILQSEWNSSPVRMAKAEKRRQKGWRHSLLCCGFS